MVRVNGRSGLKTKEKSSDPPREKPEETGN
jgi:hypothetical protein